MPNYCMNEAIVNKGRSVRVIRSYKRKTWKYVGIAGLVFITVTAVVLVILTWCKLEECSYEKSVLQEQLNSYRHVVYVAAEKLSRGTVLTEENTYQEVRYSDLPQEEFVTEDAIGKAVALDVAEGTCLTGAMLCNKEADIREVFISGVDISDNLKSGDRVDVRIRYKNAEEYIVLADKVMLECVPGKGMILELKEAELLLISSAISDCESYEDTRLYVVKYPDYRLTEERSVNYIANQDILVLLGKEKTERESRTALEQRLMQREQ